MAKSKFDFSLLTPVDEKNADFEANLTPIEDEQDPGAYLDSLPKPPGFWSKLPRNIVAGVFNAGRDFHNTPHDIAKLFEQSMPGMQQAFDQLPGPKISQGRPISEYLPNDTYNYAHALGQKGEGTLMDNLIQKGVEFTPEITGAIKILRGLPITQYGAANKLRKADKIISDLDAYVPLSSKNIEAAKPFLPNTHATREMLEAAEQGDYPSAFSTQSQVGHHERLLRKSQLPADRLLAPQAQELKQNMLSELEQTLRSRKHLSPKYEEAANLLRGGINDYRTYIKFRETIKPIIKNLGIPGSTLALLGLGLNKRKEIANYLTE